MPQPDMSDSIVCVTEALMRAAANTTQKHVVRDEQLITKQQFYYNFKLLLQLCK